MLQADLRYYIQKNSQISDIVRQEFLKALENDGLTRDESPQNHFCVYFVAYDSKFKEIFLGLHKKSGLWLANGGHIDKDEGLNQALFREIKEEWGVDALSLPVNEPEMFSITTIDNKPIQLCEKHYDVWYFIDVNKLNFFPDEKAIHTEFSEMKWLSFKEAKEHATDPATRDMIEFLKHKHV